LRHLLLLQIFMRLNLLCWTLMRADNHPVWNPRRKVWWVQ
jgi:hypothetical protein